MNKIIKKIGSGLIVTVILLSNISMAAANSPQVVGPDIDDLLYKFETEGQEPTTTDYIASLPESDPESLIGRVVFYMLVVANILAFISFIVAGIYMVVSQGNEENITKAKQIFIYTVLAMAAAATALAIVTGITNIRFF
jgi:hypothetical protein